MACDLIPVAMATTECKENFSGLPSQLYFGIPERENVAYESDASEEAETNFFTPDSFDGLDVVGVRVKAQTAKIDSTNTPNGGGFSTVLSSLIADDMDAAAVLARTLNNRNDWAAFAEDGNGNMFVAYAPGYAMRFEHSGTTGDAVDSDHGDTNTVTAAPMKYPRTKWAGHAVADSSHPGHFTLTKNSQE